ncbi:hypothetical protein R3P38DRAFT_2985086 [Favolaschia claudopus]|uniref:Uncharacterized protein n=1 Tax=Favolaschia claudopus TaxID=2862362 RepID=A0AAW0AW08_9AGAR
MMEPQYALSSLRSQPRPPSVISYWSDNMSIGPNLPLHTLSKPAIWVLYHLQARKYIKMNKDRPLSEEMLVMFETYLGYKYISSATQTMIMEHLCSRLRALEPDAVEIQEIFGRRVQSKPVETQLWKRGYGPETSGFSIVEETRNDLEAVQTCTLYYGGSTIILQP